VGDAVAESPGCLKAARSFLGSHSQLWGCPIQEVCDLLMEFQFLHPVSWLGPINFLVLLLYGGVCPFFD